MLYFWHSWFTHQDSGHRFYVAAPITLFERRNATDETSTAPVKMRPLWTRGSPAMKRENLLRRFMAARVPAGFGFSGMWFGCWICHIWRRHIPMRRWWKTCTNSAPTFVMLLPEISTPVVHKEFSSLDISKRAGNYAIHSTMVYWLADFFDWPLGITTHQFFTNGGV